VGVGADFYGPAVITDDEAAAIHDAYPRLEMTTSLVDAIVGQGRGNPAKAPRYSIAGELLRERNAAAVTEMEKAMASARWGN
jgi:hypothetical protein